MNYIKSYIYRTGKRMQDISLEIGWSKSKLSRIANNRQKPTLEEIWAILRVMKRYIPDVRITDIYPNLEEKVL